MVIYHKTYGLLSIVGELVGGQMCQLEIKDVGL